MSTRTVDEARTVLPTTPERMARLPLHAELFLLAHDDDTGEPHINRRSLALGLAGAILLQLWLTQRVAIGWTYDMATRRWAPKPGRIALTTADPTGDPLSGGFAATACPARREWAGDRRRLNPP
jgi:Golgi phosphoprotein 3 (GPP34)